MLRFCSLLLLLAPQFLWSQSISAVKANAWADSLLKTMTWKEQIAQSFMVAAWSNKGPGHAAEIEKYIQDYRVGGIIFFQGDPLRQAYLTNYFQQLSKIPLFISIDGEWGLAMRHKSVPKFPYQMTLGAVHDDSLLYQIGYQMGVECRLLGIHINFAPDVDVNTNPSNPIIGFRSFGDRPEAVAHRAAMLMKGMQDAGVMASAKHFPGHGASASDSHYELPKILQDSAQLDNVELLPFKHLIEQGVQSIMIGHLQVPALDSTPNLPSSLSKKIIQGLLKGRLGYQGLLFTDALNMKGVARYYTNGMAEALAWEAGNDFLVFPEYLPQAMQIFDKWMKEGRIDSAQVAARAKRILMAKYQYNLHLRQKVNVQNLIAQLNLIPRKELETRTAKEALTLVRNDAQLLPLKSHQSAPMAHWAIGKNGQYAFPQFLRKYQITETYFTHREAGFLEYDSMVQTLTSYPTVVISIHEMNLWGKKAVYLPQAVVQSIYRLSENTQVVLVVFGNIYLLRNLPNMPTVLMGYEDGWPYQERAAEVIFGEVAAYGTLPATAWDGYLSGAGIPYSAEKQKHFACEEPIPLGFKRDFTHSLDSLLEHAIAAGAMPGTQVLVLKNGKAAYHRALGTTDGKWENRVTHQQLYDLASVTKVAATTLAVMKLVETQKLDLDAHLSTYLPELKKTNKSKLTLRDLLLHEAGLPAFLPFYKDFMDGDYFARNPDSLHPIRIANSWFSRADLSDSVWVRIVRCDLPNKGKYVYSDLGMLMIQKVVERVTGTALDSFVSEHFYHKMGLENLTFKPTDKFYLSQIVPTTDDRYFRMEKVQGYVHDPSAALLGGVAGNAGLFANAEDLGKIFQMLLDQGIYQGKAYLKPATIADFTEKQHKNSRRGLGFDKPDFREGFINPTSDKVSPATFGHTGFTGTCVWADPQHQLVFVFLSNRTYPDENNKKILDLSVRSKALDIVMEAL